MLTFFYETLAYYINSAHKDEISKIYTENVQI
jgi:hypothetical protein